MQYFEEDHSHRLSQKEWLVKVDNRNSIPYLMTCVLMISDTKTVWAEVLSIPQLARRWVELNPHSSPSDLSSLGDVTVTNIWLNEILQYLSDMHSLGGIDDSSFEIADSKFALCKGDIVWRWNAFLVGPKFSAELLSRHLIVPLATDKVGRTARRGVGTHLKNVLMRPRLSTLLQRITALLNSSNNLPRISSEAETPEFKLPSRPREQGQVDHLVELSTETYGPPREFSMTQKHEIKLTSPTIQRAPNPECDPDAGSKDKGKQTSSLRRPPTTPKAKALSPINSDSETAPESGDSSMQQAALQLQPHTPAASEAMPLPARQSREPVSHDGELSEWTGRVLRREAPSPASDSDTASPPPKKVRPRVSTDASESSDESSAQGHSGGIVSKRGTRQPIKRGGRRF
ncbi:hypothetical protein K488DRAFT_73438 [Vararia minispora EC-137]|uniref:Uncharacterized protein n=1 Tax=Vararia minispora EC-137 TaxID=1314806 RepID=A0ACB8QAZ0_9AGAM|nr:hypothetical protein K488DRAFT_73438 [Vararia minispora EC-137]